MLNPILWQQKLWFPLHTRLHRRPDQVVENEYYVHKEGKIQRLELLLSLLAQVKCVRHMEVAERDVPPSHRTEPTIKGVPNVLQYL